MRARKWSVSTNRENLGYATLAASASARMQASSSPLPNGWNTILVKTVMSFRPATAWPTKSSERPAPYASALSTQLTPWSKAARIAPISSSSGD